MNAITTVQWKPGTIIGNNKVDADRLARGVLTDTPRAPLNLHVSGCNRARGKG